MLLTLYKEPFMAAGSLLKPFASLDLKKAPLRSDKSDRDATTAVAAALEVLRPQQRAGRVRRKHWWRLDMQR